MSRELSREEFAHVRKAIADAEQGRATLGQLAKAHEICERVGANDTLGVVREHIRRTTPAPKYHTELKSIFLGVISGTLTWVLLGNRPNFRSLS